MTAYGYAREARKYNAQNLVTECAWYDEHGKLVCFNGLAKIRYDYDDNGNMTAKMFFDADDRLVSDENNVAISRWLYNESGRLMECRYFGSDCRPVLHKSEGAAFWQNIFNASGDIVGCKQFDVNGKVIIVKEAQK